MVICENAITITNCAPDAQPKYFPLETKKYLGLYWVSLAHATHLLAVPLLLTQTLQVGTIPFTFIRQGSWVLPVNKLFLSYA